MQSISAKISALDLKSRTTPTRSGRRREHSNTVVKGCRQLSRPAGLRYNCTESDAAGLFYIKGYISSEVAAATLAEQLVMHPNTRKASAAVHFWTLSQNQKRGVTTKHLNKIETDLL